MEYISTRGGCPPTDFTGALMQGLAPDGGLYVPASWPRLSSVTANQAYIETAMQVLTPFIGTFCDTPTLRTLLKAAYASFSDPAVTPPSRGAATPQGPTSISYTRMSARPTSSVGK